MSTVSKISIGNFWGFDVVFVEGDFPMYGKSNTKGLTDEEIVETTLKREDHTVYATDGTEQQDLAQCTNVRVLYEA